MEIERARIEDVDDIERLLYEVHDVHATGRPDLFIKGKKKYTRDEILSLMKSESTPVYVYRRDAKVVGYAFIVYMQPVGDSLVKIKTMYVDDVCVDSRLKRSGIGTIIFRDLEEIARREGCHHILLNVYNFNESAMNFYKKCGMTPLKTYMEKVIK